MAAQEAIERFNAFKGKANLKPDGFRLEPEPKENEVKKRFLAINGRGVILLSEGFRLRARQGKNPAAERSEMCIDKVASEIHPGNIQKARIQALDSLIASGYAIKDNPINIRVTLQPEQVDSLIIEEGEKGGVKYPVYVTHLNNNIEDNVKKPDLNLKTVHDPTKVAEIMLLSQNRAKRRA